MLKQLTQDYIKAFGTKDINAISNMLCADFTLCDPEIKKSAVNGIQGKEACLKAMQGIFDGCKALNFKARNIFVCENTTLIEFSLQIDSVLLEGVDIIEWEKSNEAFLMKELRAYLDMPKG